MGKYSYYADEFLQEYEQPTVDEYIVGFSGIDPLKKIKAGQIDHEKLGGLIGGDISGHWHLTREQLQQFKDYQARIQEIKEEAERRIKDIKDFTESAEKELNSRMTGLEGSQSELEASQESISTRFEAIIGSVTEDTEILDARVDASGTIHPNLGHNIRSIHNEIFENEGKSRECLETVREHLQEQADYLSGAVLNNIFTLNNEIKERRQTDQEISQAVEQTGSEVSEIGENVRSISKRLGNEDEENSHFQEQIDDLASGVMTLATNEYQHFIKYKNEFKHERERLNDQFLYLQEQADDLASMGLQLAIMYAENKGYKAVAVKNPLDWSKTTKLAIPEPRCAVVNISGINAMPTSKTVDVPAVMEFWDMQGNFFRKKIVCAAQGNSSLRFPKDNLKFDLLNEDGSEFELRIGSWVVQDGFHLKAYYTDYFRGVAVPGYKLYDEILRFNGIDKDRPWKKELGVTEGVTPTGGQTDDLELQLDTGALCHPDGFPCIVYLNDAFYGIFSWQLKKHRNNYHMEKSNVEHIHLDGTLYVSNFWGGNINWSAFEVRNPNKLFTMDGQKYDGDNPKELIDATSAKYDASNKDHVRTAKVKKHIQDFVSSFQELKSLYATYNSSPSDDNLSAVKAKYNQIFDCENIRDYMIFGDTVGNRDGYGKNWQWTTYDGTKWYVNAYDLDLLFGGQWLGEFLNPPETKHLGSGTGLPTGYIPVIYKTELERRYRQLRDAGIISVEHIISLLDDWTKRVGISNYELEFEKWPNSPCLINYKDSIYRVKKWLDQEISNMDALYSYPGADYRITVLENTVNEILGGGALEYKGAAVALTGEVDDMMNDVFDGDGTEGQPISTIPDELKDELTTDDEFDDMLNDVFNP